MKVISYTGSGQQQRMVVYALLTSKDVLKSVAPIWDVKAGLLRSKEANLVASWAVHHFRKYDEPVGAKVLNYLERHLEKRRDKTEAALLQKFLEDLNQEMKRKTDVNPKFALDQAEAVFNEVWFERMTEQLRKEGEKQTDRDYQKILAEYSKPPSVSSLSAHDVFDPTMVAGAFSDESKEVLVDYPGEAGKFFGKDLCRSGFVAFLAPEKRGKSLWLIDLAYRAVLQRRRVLFMSVGDLTEGDVIRRFGMRAARHPKYACQANYPTDIYQETEGGPDPVWKVTSKRKTWESNLTDKKVLEAWAKIKAEKIKSENEYLKFVVHPASSCKATKVRSEALNLSYAGWVPDLIVIDYADILAPESGTADTRDGINNSWKVLNGIRMELNCLVVTATQADAASYGKDLLDETNFSEDKRKGSHITGMIGINQTIQEKEIGVQRLNWIFRRDDDFNKKRVVACGGCREIHNPCIVSKYPPYRSSDPFTPDQKESSDD